MKNEIKQEDIRKFNLLSNIFAILFIVCIIIPYPLGRFLGWVGLAIYIILWGITMFFAFKVEKMKKSNNIQTYKEIVAFMNGNHLDEITKHREEGKRIYQKILLSIGSGLLTIALFFVMILLFE